MLTEKQMKIYQFFKDNKGITTYAAGIQLGMAPYYVGTIIRNIEEKGYIRIARVNGQRDFSQIMFIKKPELYPIKEKKRVIPKSNKNK